MVFMEMCFLGTKYVKFYKIGKHSKICSSVQNFINVFALIPTFYDTFET